MRAWWIVPLWWGCTGKDPEETGYADADTDADSDADVDTDTDTDADGDTDTDTDADADTEPDMPADPRPLTLTIAGGYSGTLVFDAPTCSYYDATPNFRAFWRNAAQDHVFVLIAEVLGPFTGPGTYTQDQATTRVKLQEEAGGSGYYFGSTGSDQVAITVEYVSENQAFGSFTVDRLSDGGGVTISPQPIPIWCPEMN